MTLVTAFPWSFCAEILTALLLGSVIGFERQWHQRMAGLRTNALVALGAAIFVELSKMAAMGSAGADPTRIAAQVVTGIGFLGGGLIIKEGFNVRGLNTAATLWCSAAVGSMAGAGAVLPAVLAAVAVLGTNVVLRRVVYRINCQPVRAGSEVDTAYTVELTCRARAETHLRGLLLQEAAKRTTQLRAIRRELVDGSGEIRLGVELVVHGRDDALIESLVSQLSLETSVNAASWQARQV